MAGNPEPTPARKDKISLLFRVAASVLWAFPLSGITKGIVDFDQNNFLFRDDYSKNLLAFVADSVRFGLATMITGGFPPDDAKASGSINMYPYIVPTALLLFFLLSRGWRSFEWPGKAR